MRTNRVLYASMVRAGIAVFLAVSLAGLSVCQPTGEAVSIDNDDLGGVVTSTQGPEAGVWVIAETDDLETVFRKIVVTDDDGKFLMPEMPVSLIRLLDSLGK